VPSCNLVSCANCDHQSFFRSVANTSNGHRRIYQLPQAAVKVESYRTVSVRFWVCVVWPDASILKTTPAPDAPPPLVIP
jgi:hypothetical protein